MKCESCDFFHLRVPGSTVRDAPPELALTCMRLSNRKAELGIPHFPAMTSASRPTRSSAIIAAVTIIER